ncbi:MAG: L-lactate MFS transporter [Clostridium sp.]|uniref:L-lactate MFS transporter n=1 Tax=Clostridium sp. TaxID=1506 RepID=UPI003D6D60A3
MKQKQTNRWIVLIASIFMNLCIGSAYAWSVFQKPLIEMFGWQTTQASLTFTINLCLVPFAMIVAGRIQDKRGPKKVTLVGGLIFGAGVILSGFTSSLTVLYLTYGVLGGLGIGTVYGCTIANTVKWFPDKRGLAGGLVAAGFGSGAVLFAPLSVSLIENFGVLSTFKILGFVFMLCIVACSFAMKAPEAGWKPEGWVPKVLSPTAIATVTVDMTPGQMVKDVKFYVLWIMYTIGCISGLMIIGHASPIAQEKIGLTPQVAAVIVSVLAFANSGGRIFWGSVSDKIGRYNAILGMYILSSGMLILLSGAKTTGVFVVAVCGIALSFGGFLGIFPSVTADNFGSKNIGVNYGVMFTAFGLAAFVGPRLAAMVKEASGGEYGTAFLIVAIMNIAGIIFTFVIKKLLKKQSQLNQASI